MALTPRRRWQAPSARTERTPRWGIATSLALHVLMFGGMALWFTLPVMPPDEPLVPTPQGLVLCPMPTISEPVSPATVPAVDVPAEPTSTNDSTEVAADTTIEVPSMEPVHETAAVVISHSTPSTTLSRLVTATPHAHGPAANPASVINAALGASPSSSPAATKSTPAAIAWNPTFVSGKDPIYPRSARRQHHEGTVRLQLCIEWTGSVLSASVLRSSGSPDLDEAAVAAALAWQFSPRPTNNLEPLKQVELDVVFRLVSAQTTTGLQVARQ